ncbi:MAG: argininosuccinate synthase [Chlamydiota bacterium]|nr:argininosuccinate synthase [Chlamydiota bacterium]
MADTVILAYSGGLDTSVILHWLKHEKGLNVVAYVADLGQAEELDSIEERAIQTGAVECIVDNLREEFVRDYVMPMIQANAVYEGYYLLGTSIARPLIAKGQIQAARARNAAFVSHGSTGKGNDQIRFELAYYALHPEIRVIAPWREWNFVSRQDLINYALTHHIQVPVTKEKPYSSDRNLVHISFEGGILEDPWSSPPDNMFILTTDPKIAPDKAEQLTIDFCEGYPVAVNGENLSPLAVMETLNRMGSRHGIGRVDIVENRFVGMKSRGVYESPGATILYHAHRAMESITLDRGIMHLKEDLMHRYAVLVYNGFWFSPEMEILRETISLSQKDVSGTVKLELYKGNCTIKGRKSPKSLYFEELATFEGGQMYRQADATGFINLQALRLKMEALRKKKFSATVN